MATIFASITGITLVRKAEEQGTDFDLAEVRLELGAYATASDTAQIGGGGFNRGAATTQTLAQILAAMTRDSKTVTLKHASLFGTGRDASFSTMFWTGAFDAATSPGNLRFNLKSSDESTGIDAPQGVKGRPIGVLVAFVRS